GHTGDANEAGAYAKLVYLPCRPSNGFIPLPPKKHVDAIYLCSPNNPTGAAANRPQLEAWVKYALENKSVILFDAAYEAYITDRPDSPVSSTADGLKKLFKIAQKNGYLTYDDINGSLPEMISPENLDKVLTELRQKNVNIVDATKTDKDKM